MRDYTQPQINRARPIPARLKQRETVTIAAGILCIDGIVLCSDTEETISEGRKAQASKIRKWMFVYFPEGIPEGEDVRVSIGLAGAGHSDWIQGFIHGMNKLLENYPDDKKLELEAFEEVLGDFTQTFFEKYIRGYAENPEHRPQTYMLVFAQFPHQRAIYRIHENLVLKDDEAAFVAVGAGAPVFRSFAESLLGKGNSYRMPWTMKQAASVAIYILDKVKSEVPGCGGNSHIVMIGKDGEEDEVPTQKIKAVEAHHATIEAAMYKTLAKKLMKKLP